MWTVSVLSAFTAKKQIHMSVCQMVTDAKEKQKAREKWWRGCCCALRDGQTRLLRQDDPGGEI